MKEVFKLALFAFCVMSIPFVVSFIVGFYHGFQ